MEKRKRIQKDSNFPKRFDCKFRKLQIPEIAIIYLYDRIWANLTPSRRTNRTTSSTHGVYESTRSLTIRTTAGPQIVSGKKMQRRSKFRTISTLSTNSTVSPGGISIPPVSLWDRSSFRIRVTVENIIPAGTFTRY